MRQECRESISLAKRFFAFLDLGLTQRNSVFIELVCTVIGQFRGGRKSIKKESEDSLIISLEGQRRCLDVIHILQEFTINSRVLQVSVIQLIRSDVEFNLTVWFLEHTISSNTEQHKDNICATSIATIDKELIQQEVLESNCNELIKIECGGSRRI